MKETRQILYILIFGIMMNYATSQNCGNLKPGQTAPDPEDCASFYLCVDGFLLPMKCRPPLLYNSTFGACDNNTKCEIASTTAATTNPTVPISPNATEIVPTAPTAPQTPPVIATPIPTPSTPIPTTPTPIPTPPTPIPTPPTPIPTPPTPIPTPPTPIPTPPTPIPTPPTIIPTPPTIIPTPPTVGTTTVPTPSPIMTPTPPTTALPSRANPPLSFEPNPCTDRATGTYVMDPSSCKSFFYCYQGLTISSNCPDGYLFNSAKSMCSDAVDVPCLIGQ